MVVSALDDSCSRADISAGAAIDASICVDYIDIAFGDCSGRAFGLARATCNASVSNFVSHDD